MITAFSQTWPQLRKGVVGIKRPGKSRIDHQKETVILVSVILPILRTAHAEQAFDFLPEAAFGIVFTDGDDITIGQCDTAEAEVTRGKNQLPEINAVIDAHDLVDQPRHRKTRLQRRPAVIQLIHSLAIHFRNNRLAGVTQKITAGHRVGNSFFLVQILRQQLPVKTFHAGIQWPLFQIPQCRQSRQANRLDQIRIGRLAEKIAPDAHRFRIVGTHRRRMIAGFFRNGVA